MRLADPATPLGMLQRGRGAGHLWALNAPREEVQSLVMECMREDPRRDRQLDRIGNLYLEVFEARGLDFAPLEEILKGPGHDPDLRRAEQATELALEILVAVSVGGTPKAGEATRILHEYLATGTAWASAANAVLDAWRRRVRDIAWVEATIATRFPDDEQLRRAMDSVDSFCWGMFVEDGVLHHPRILAMAASLEAEVESDPRDPRPPLKPIHRTTEDLLALAPGLTSQWSNVAEELARRRGPGDRETLLAALRDSAAVDARILSIHALALQGEKEVFGPAIDLLVERAGRRYLRGKLIKSIQALPPSLTLPWAREWYGGDDVPRHDLASWILEEHAEPMDRTRIETVIVRALADCPWEEPPACVCSDLEALGHAGAAESRPLLEQVFRDTADTSSRVDAMEMLVATPGGLPKELAIEGLWDGCDSVRELAAKWAPLDAPGVRERLRVLAAREREDESAAAVAAERLEA